MEIKRETTLNQAVETIRMFLEQVQDSRVSVGDHEIGGDTSVELEIEIASSDSEMELEFEIKWRAPQDQGGEQPWQG